MCRIFKLSLRINILREIYLATFYKVAYISDVLTELEIILFLMSKCTILGSKDAKVEGESLFTELTCVGIVPKLSTLKSHLSTARTKC